MEGWGGVMLSVAELWDLIDEVVTPLDSERVDLETSAGRRIVEDVLADTDLPAFDRSAIDGYCVRNDAGSGRFRLVGEVRPGAPAGEVPATGEAVKIFTGSALPSDGVGLVMVEDAEVDGEWVELRVAPKVELIRKRASQQRAGEVVLRAGSIVNSGALAVLAMVGLGRPLVSGRPSVAHLVTGSELVDVDQVPGPGEIRDSNGPLIAALVAEAGAAAGLRGRATESVDEAEALLGGCSADVLLVSGGASVGDHDGTAALFERLGFEILSSRVRSRPGKPLIFARRGGQVAFGLPGNPLSHFVCFHLFVRRALDRLAGREPKSLIDVRCDDLPSPDARETWWPARIVAEAGALRACPLPWTDSSDLTGLAPANALLRVPTEPGNTLAQAMVFGSIGS